MGAPELSLFLAQPMSSSSALLRFVPPYDSSEAGLTAAPCIHTMPRDHQVKKKGYRPDTPLSKSGNVTKVPLKRTTAL
uniref:Uncharacterized protein n=1 Tax=Taeniopygia guttata TaxID=59729 RepID=A0A674H2D8_TAEGU